MTSALIQRQRELGLPPWPRTGMLRPRDVVAWAQARLAAPPLAEGVDRVLPQGELVACFALGLDLCQSTNRTSRLASAQPWAAAARKKALWTQLLLQRPTRRPVLAGRPQVLAVRFSATRPDRYANWAKTAVDYLCLPRPPRRHGLGLLVDDRPDHIDEHQWWEPCSPKAGCVYLEVWTGRDPEKESGR